MRESSEGPLLFRTGSRRTFLLSQTEMAAVACMDGSLTLESIAAKVLVRHGRTSYAGLIQLYQSLAAAGFLSEPVPRLGVLGARHRTGWIFDLPLVVVPGFGRHSPPLPARATALGVLATTSAVAALLSLPALVALVQAPAASAAIAGVWEAAVVALYAAALFASLCRALCRAAWLRAHEGIHTDRRGGLRLRNGLLAFDTADPDEHLRPPGERASLGRAGLLGLVAAAGILGAASLALPPDYASAAPYALVPWLLVFIELCPFVPGSDGARLAAPSSSTPAARARLVAALVQPRLSAMAAALLRGDRASLRSLAWLATAVLLPLGAPGPTTAAWAASLSASDNLALRIAGAVPFVAWGAVGVVGVIGGIISVARRILLTVELRTGGSLRPRTTVPDEEADRVLLSMPPLGVLPQTRRRGEAERLVTRVVRQGERLGGDSARALFAVAVGAFRLECPDAPPIEFGPGDVFLGRMAALGSSAEADVLARSAGRLRALGADAVDRLLGEIPEARGALTETLLSRAALRSCAAFAALPAHALEVLLTHSESMVVAPGATIGVDSHASAAIFLIRRGRARAAGDGALARTAGPSELLGLDPLFHGHAVPRTWVAITRCHLLRLPVRGLADILHRAAGVGLALESHNLADARARRRPLAGADTA